MSSRDRIFPPPPMTVIELRDHLDNLIREYGIEHDDVWVGELGPLVDVSVMMGRPTLIDWGMHERL